MKSKTTHRGFTILEVIIVLAIASLITLMVLLAVGAANRSARDTKRRADALLLGSALEQWAQNHSGNLPRSTGVATDIGITGFNTLDSTKQFCVQNYLVNKCLDFKQSGGTPYTFTADSFPNLSAPPAAVALTCSSTNVGLMQVKYDSARDYTIKACLETGMYTLNP